MRAHIFMLSVSSALLTLPALAGRVDVINENKKALKIRVEAEGNKVTEELASYTKEIPAENFFTFLVDASDLKGKSHYSIKGDTTAFTPGDKCQHLSIDKNYKVTFLNDAVGTSCIAEELF